MPHTSYAHYHAAQPLSTDDVDPFFTFLYYLIILAVVLRRSPIVAAVLPVSAEVEVKRRISMDAKKRTFHVSQRRRNMIWHMAGWPVLDLPTVSAAGTEGSNPTLPTVAVAHKLRWSMARDSEKTQTGVIQARTAVRVETAAMLLARAFAHAPCSGRSLRCQGSATLLLADWDSPQVFQFALDLAACRNPRVRVHICRLLPYVLRTVIDSTQAR
ncbi:hypothetical protein P171DRAFT_472184 [Karstenula rhodostoma CBS 690.94]|uniref:Uncharacterized protein n=1 Tax=Karstenula rhodostoma CBS 690.94 TaxID=1392251 RepID=A0A9P4PJY2_9PLEO|nr:hypothetical protein P171DRAFT_472184 [Karstenula rhodostoma CBS 690.94]